MMFNAVLSSISVISRRPVRLHVFSWSSFKPSHWLLSHITIVETMKSGDIRNYNLPNANNIYNIACRTNLYKNSFLPSVVDEWNLNFLPQEISNSKSVSKFKHYLNIGKLNPNKLFFVGKRRFQSIHARLRNECSSLKHHLFIRNILETNQHYFLNVHRNERNFFLSSISHFSRLVDLNTLPFGSDALGITRNYFFMFIFT